MSDYTFVKLFLALTIDKKTGEVVSVGGTNAKPFDQRGKRKSAGKKKASN